MSWYQAQVCHHVPGMGAPVKPKWILKRYFNFLVYLPLCREARKFPRDTRVSLEVMRTSLGRHRQPLEMTGGVLPFLYFRLPKHTEQCASKSVRLRIFVFDHRTLDIS